MKKISIFDTTLRDGTQGVGINFTLNDKIEIAHALDDAGVDYIEGGFPLASKRESDFFKITSKENFKNAKITAFGSTRKPGRKAKDDENILALLNAESPTVVVVGKAWGRHITDVIRTDFEENLAMIDDSIRFLVSEGREVIFDLEHFFDGYKQHPEYSLEILKLATAAGASNLALCDTNGGTLPSDVSNIINGLPQNELASLGVHFHNDIGCAVANSMIAVDSGATNVQGTINGWGERCGNANLCSIIPNLSLKMNCQITMNKNMDTLTHLSRYIAEKANIIPEKNQPYVGTAAFAHKAGQHADVIAKNPELMEHIPGTIVGNERQILLSELAGKSTILEKIRTYGKFDKNSPEVVSLFNTLKEKEGKGFEYETAEASFDLLVKKSLGLYKPLFELNNYHLETYKTWGVSSKTVGRIFLKTGGKEYMGAGVGVGPVGTLDAAVRDALKDYHKFLNNMSLIDYKVRVLNPEDSTNAKVRVFVSSTDGDKSWETVGVSENIIEASWQALVDSMEYYYNNVL
ncbi:MAG: citramalate synthase [Spirochaetaceae bacterium 4572_7]|nr:MAG: citramalate synthase [Spirochaetaceae bacterium 4572_7]